VEAEHRKLVEEAVLNEPRFLRAVFSGRLPGHSLPWQRIVVRPIQIKGEVHVQFTYYDEAKSIDRNRRGQAIREELTSILQMPFRNIHVETVDREVQVNVTRKGKAIARSSKKAAPATRVLSHDRQKRLPLPPGQRDEYLLSVGIMAEDGRVRADKYDKFRQINEFLRLLAQTVAPDDEALRPKYIVDFGCGNAYLTFATYHYFHNVLRQPMSMCGVDAREAPLAAHRAEAAKLQWPGLAFEAGTIAAFDPPQIPDMVLSLHACDTATDDAIARAIQWHSRYVLSVPCCHHDLQQQLRTREDATALKPVYRYGVLAERLGDVLTDTLRALILRICGYRCDVVQFVSSEHTAKNLMIRATRAGRVGDPTLVEEYLRLKDFLAVTPYLERVLGGEFQGLLASAHPVAV
jgi:SAM-dependent methyltransferase